MTTWRIFLRSPTTMVSPRVSSWIAISRLRAAAVKIATSLATMSVSESDARSSVGTRALDRSDVEHARDHPEQLIGLAEDRGEVLASGRSDTGPARPSAIISA